METYVFFVVFGLLGVYFTIEPYFYSDKTATWVNPQRAKIVHRKMAIWVEISGRGSNILFKTFFSYIYSKFILTKFLNHYGVHPKSLTLALPPLHLHPILLCYIPSKLPFLRWRWQSQDVKFSYIISTVDGQKSCTS